MTAFDIGGMGAKGATVRRLFGAVQQFLARTDVSPEAAAAIKALLDELHPDDVHLQEVADKLALYRLGGGKKALGEREIRESLKGVESHLRRTLLPRRTPRERVLRQVQQSGLLPCHRYSGAGR